MITKKVNIDYESAQYKEFEMLFIKLLDYQQYDNEKEGFDYEESFKGLIKHTWNCFHNEKQEFNPDIETWLKSFYKDNKQGTHQIWLKKQEA